MRTESCRSQVDTPPLPATNPAGQTVTADEQLFSALRQLPEASPRQTVLWIPRRCRQQASDILRQLLVAATDTLDLPLGSRRAEIDNRLMRASGMLLFRQLPDQKDNAAVGCGGGEPGAVATAIRKRLRLAANSQWQELVDDCLSDLQSGPARQSSPTQAGDSISDGALQAAAVKAKHGSLRGAAAILTSGPRVPPGLETDEKVKQLFRTEALTVDEAAGLDDALATAAGVASRNRMSFGPRHASRSCARLQPAAGPGTSGFRNTYILTIQSHPDGPRALAAWASSWSRGGVAPWIAELWTAALVRPFFKANLTDVRPILCAEALLKLAVGISVKGADRQISAAVGPSQYGAGRSGGASLEVAEVRAAAQLCPERPLVSMDMANAVGSLTWTSALQVVARSTPKLSPLLAAQ